MPAIVGIISVDFEVSSHDRVENLAWKMAHEGNEGRGYFYRHLEGEATKGENICKLGSNPQLLVCLQSQQFVKLEFFGLLT